MSSRMASDGSVKAQTYRFAVPDAIGQSRIKLSDIAAKVRRCLSRKAVARLIPCGPDKDATKRARPGYSFDNFVGAGE